ncbi:MAG: DUF4124 domain-containing protein [Sedimenticola sp.]|nr:DUF4124 domain-containing protein [Sedimenticola sp.]
MKVMQLSRTVLVSGFVFLSIYTIAVSAESYKCVQEGVVVYSDTRCGPVIEKSKEVQNSYSGGIRPGEAQMLNDALKQAPAAGPAGATTGESYGERIRRENADKKARGNERRIERDAESPWR